MNYPQIQKLGSVLIQSYERYLPTAFDESMTLLQKVNKVIEYLNTTGLTVNSAIDLIELAITNQDLDIVALQEEVTDYKTLITNQQNDFEANITDSLLPTNIDTLFKSWYANGTLSSILNNGVFNMKADQVDLDLVIQDMAGKAEKGQIAVSDINKNLGLFDQTYMSPTLMQQITGTAPVNAIPSDNSLTTVKYVDGSVTNKKIQHVDIGKVMNSLITERDYTGLWNDAVPVSTVSISDNYILFENKRDTNVGLIFREMDVSEIKGDTLYIRMSLKNPNASLNPWIFSSTNALVQQFSTFSISADYKDVYASITKQAIIDLGLTKFKLALVTGVGTVGVFAVSEIRNLTVNDNNLKRTFSEGLIKMNNVVTNRIPLESITKWNSNALNTITIKDNELVYNQLATGDSGISVPVDMTEYKTLDTIYISYETLTNSSNVDIYLFTDTGLLKESIGKTPSNINYTTGLIKIDESLLLKHGITNKRFRIVFANHTIDKFFRIKNIQVGVLKYGTTIEESVKKLFSNTKIRKTEKIGQGVDFSKVAHTPVSVTGHHFCTPNSYSYGDMILKELRVYTTVAGVHTFTTGIIDQNSLLVNQSDFVETLKVGYNVIDMESKNIKVPFQNRVFMKLSNTNILYNPTDPLTKYVPVLIQDEATTINTGGYSGMTFHDTPYMIPFGYTLIEKDSKQELNDVIESLNELSEQVNSGDTSQLNGSLFVKPDGSKSRFVVDANGVVVAVDLIPQNVSIMGNSLTNGFGTHGMASSTVLTDYYAVVSNYLESVNPNVVISGRQSASSWESLTTSQDRQNWWNTTGTNLVDANADLVIVQLVDNVNTPEKEATFAVDVKTLITNIRLKAPKARVLWVAGWYVAQWEIDAIKVACTERGGEFVDITQYKDDAQYKSFIGATYTDQNGVTQTVSSAGVASHPGDLGMQKIGEEIIKVISLA